MNNVGLFLFQDFNKSYLATELTDKQASVFRANLMALLLKFTNNSNITLEYLAKHLHLAKSSVEITHNKISGESKNYPERPFIYIDADFMLENTLIAVCITVEFNPPDCFIPLTYKKYELHIHRTESSGLFKVLDLYKPDVGFSYFYFGSFRDDLLCTITTRDAFKFQHLITTNPRKFYIEYKLKKNTILSSQIVNDDTDEYVCHSNKALPVADETLFIHFCNAAYTKHSEFINGYIKDGIDFRRMQCFAELKKIFLNVYTSKNRERLLDELLIYQMIDI